MFRQQSFRAIYFLLLIVFLRTPALAVTEYVGPDSGNWFTPENWTDGVPDENAEALIANGNTVFLSSDTASSQYVVLDNGSGVSVSGTLLQASGITVGNTTSGTLSLSNGAIVATDSFHVAVSTGHSATVDIDGSALTSFTNTFASGGGSTATLTVRNGGQYDALEWLRLGEYDGDATATVTGTGSKVTALELTLGYYGKGSLTVSDGGKVEASYVSVGSGTDSEGSLTVTGSGSEMLVTHDEFAIGSYTDDTDYAVGTVTIANGGTLSVIASNEETGAVEVLPKSTLKIGNGGTAGNLQADSVNLGGDLVFDHAGDVVFNTPIHDSSWVSGATGTIIKQGGGRLTLSANSEFFTGNIDVREGTLAVNANLTRTNATVSGAGILGGEAILADLDVIDGGTVSPGDGIGTILVDVAFLDEGGVYLWEISSAIGDAGTDWDLLDAYEYLFVGGTSDNPFTIEIVSDAVAGFDPTQTYSWMIVQSGAVPVNFDEEVFTINASGFVPAPYSNRFSLSLNGTDVYLTYSPVPEPAEWGILGAVGMLAIALRRRRGR